MLQINLKLLSSMSDQPRPNLFHYATSELSQDAFICWLAAWADPKFNSAENSALHQAGTDFIRSMLAKKDGCDVAIIKAVKVSRQVGKLDVLIEINKLDPDAPGELAILIEDKTHTFDHSNQLNRYYDEVAKTYAIDKMIPLYFKTGYQSRFDTLGVFKTYVRKDFLTVLTKGRERVNNAIYQDFLAHLENMEENVNQFSTKAPEGWQDNDWRGFFMELYPHKELYGADWGHVNNRSGGFMGFWWGKKFCSEPKYWAYPQLESLYRKPDEVSSSPALCLKVVVDDKLITDAV